jgi:hypothetical protein
MRTDLNKNIQKNKSLNSSMQNPSILNIDDINKAIELTRFNVSKNNSYSLNNNIEN